MKFCDVVAINQFQTKCRFGRTEKNIWYIGECIRKMKNFYKQILSHHPNDRILFKNLWNHNPYLCFLFWKKKHFFWLFPQPFPQDVFCQFSSPYKDVRITLPLVYQGNFELMFYSGLYKEGHKDLFLCILFYMM